MDKKDKITEKLEHHASSCQMDADELAVRIIKMRSMSVVQSICDFNLFWLYDISPEFLLHMTTIDFLKKNIKKFNRKITIKEIFAFDFIIRHHNIKRFEQLKEKYT